MARVFIIAEAGVNHNGDIELAYKLIDAAKETGVDAVKFQTFKTEQIIGRRTEMVEYQKKNIWLEQTQFEMLKKLELSFADFRKLKHYADDQGIMFLSTPDEAESLDFLADELDLPMIKIGSGEITNLPFLKRIAQKNRPIILSTGMASLSEVGEAIDCILFNPQWYCSADPAITLLHCTTNYPTPYAEVNLRAMATLHQTFKLAVGYSDHTAGIEIPMAAVALGATVIEKHFTLDRNLPGPDHPASLTPTELKTMVEGIRNIEKAMGNGVKAPTLSEIKGIPVIRKSLLAAKDLRKGHILTEDDIAIKRPGTGIPPKYKDTVMGMKLTRDIGEDEPIEWGCFKDSSAHPF